MDVERVVLFAGFSFALGIGAFILWGPTPKPKKRGHVNGIENLGYTCFLNSLLQSLAACPYFIYWLKTQKKKKVSNNFIDKLTTVIDRINGYSEDVYSDVVPTEIIANLGSLWTFDPSHQDVHELFHVVLSALRSETQIINRKGCLSDALPVNSNIVYGMQECCYPARKNIICHDITQGELNTNFGRVLNKKHKYTFKSSSMSICGFPMNKKPGVIFTRSSEMLTYSPMINYTNENMEESTLRLFMPFTHECNSFLLHESLPFSGLLISQLKCTNCNCKSSVRYDKLETVSLPLPPSSDVLKWQQHSLSELFTRLVANEIIHNVACDGCESRCLAIKSLALGKLPKCLCLHIPRTTWSTSGMPIKREDPVIFPEIFILDPYTFTESMKRNVQVILPMMMNKNYNVDQAKHKYKLQAVVEHRGPVDTGHFVCYRRGNKCNQWLYTSDSIVENIPLTNVLCANPYLLFYERIIDQT